MSEYITITQLNKSIKLLFEQSPFLRRLSVMGEISNFKKHSSGTYYFTLKDESSDLRAIMFQSNASKMATMPTNGQKVIATGDVSVYEARGEYQLYVTLMRPFGAGDIYARLEALKEQITKEGLLDPARKKPLPKFPRVVGVITSSTGAAIQDIQHTLERRFPLATLRLYPALVQGDDAKYSIVEQIQKANAEAVADVLIVGRGGGSIEDLWAFNEELVVRAIANSTIPIISAVGHETDTTLADFVADMRAPTPTAAAELAVPDQIDIQQGLANTNYYLKQTIARRWQEAFKQYERALHSYVFQQPERLLQSKDYQYERLVHRLLSMSPTNKVERIDQALQTTTTKLTTRFDQRLQRLTLIAQQLETSLAALNPKSVLQRGYAMVQVGDTVIDSVARLSKDQTIQVTFNDGQVDANIDKIRRH
jgi:exodeoxyribonuclease VII large subunit